MAALGESAFFGAGGHLHVALHESVAGLARQFWSHHSLEAVLAEASVTSQLAGAGEAWSCGVLVPQMQSFVHCGVSGLAWQFSSHQLPEAVSMMPVQLCPRLAMRCAASVAL